MKKNVYLLDLNYSRVDVDLVVRLGWRKAQRMQLL
jgi:hypothetical protein